MTLHTLGITEVGHRGTPASDRTLNIFLLVGIVIIGGALRYSTLSRPGYWVDEDLTWLAVDGIRHSGYPVLPSGVSYERGLLYSYLTAACTVPGGSAIPCGRHISAVAGLGLVCAVFLLARFVATNETGLVAAAFVAVNPTLIVIAQLARFYSVHLLFEVLAVWSYFRWRSHAGGQRVFLLLVAASYLTHEFGLALVAVPTVAVFAAREPDSRQRALRDLGSVAIVLVVIEAALRTGHYLASQAAVMPESGSSIHIPIVRAVPAAVVSSAVPVAWVLAAVLLVVSLRRLNSDVTVRFVGAGMALASGWFQLGTSGLGGVLGAVLRPERALVLTAFAVACVSVSLTTWTVAFALSRSLPIDQSLVRSLAAYGISYPLDAFAYLTRHAGVTLGVFIAATLWFVYSAAVTREPRDESVAIVIVLAWLWWAFLGLLNTSLEPRHYVVPLVFTTVVCALPIGRLFETSPGGPVWTGFFVAALSALLVGGVWSDAMRQSTTAVEFVGGLPALRRLPSTVASCQTNAVAMAAGTRLICNDELGCLYAFGRVDEWLAFEPVNRGTFGVVMHSQLVGRYSGSRAVDSVAALKEVISRSPALLVLQQTSRVAAPTLESLLPAFEASRVRVLCEDPALTIVASWPSPR